MVRPTTPATQGPEIQMCPVSTSSLWVPDRSLWQCGNLTLLSSQPDLQLGGEDFLREVIHELHLRMSKEVSVCVYVCPQISGGLPVIEKAGQQEMIEDEGGEIGKGLEALEFVDLTLEAKLAR